MAKLIEITGKALPGEWGTDDENGVGIPVLRTTNFTNEGVVDYDNVVTRTITKKNIEEKFLRHGDIIIEKSGGSDKQPVGRVIFFEGPENTFLFNNFTGLLRVKNKENWNPRYVFYALYGNYRQGGTRAFQNKTTGLHNLKTDDYVSSFEIRELPMTEQVAVCELLDKVQSTIKNRQQQLTALETLIKARFVEMFGEPEANTKGWPVVNMADLCTVGSSKRIYQSEQTLEGVPFWRISDLTTLINTGVVTADLFIPEERYMTLQAQGQVPVEGDILVTSRGTLGQCYIVKSADKFYFQDGMISWLSDYAGGITPVYIAYLFSMPGFRKQIDAMQAGSTVTYLSIAMIKRLKVMLPDMETQNRFAAFVAQTDKSKVVVQSAQFTARNIHCRRKQKCRILNF